MKFVRQFRMQISNGLIQLARQGQYRCVVEFRTDFCYRNLTQYVEKCTCSGPGSTVCLTTVCGFLVVARSRKI